MLLNIIIIAIMNVCEAPLQKNKNNKQCKINFEELNFIRKNYNNLQSHKNVKILMN